MFATEKISGKV